MGKEGEGPSAHLRPSAPDTNRSLSLRFSSSSVLAVFLMRIFRHLSFCTYSPRYPNTPTSSPCRHLHTVPLAKDNGVPFRCLRAPRQQLGLGKRRRKRRTGESTRTRGRASGLMAIFKGRRQGQSNPIPALQKLFIAGGSGVSQGCSCHQREIKMPARNSIQNAFALPLDLPLPQASDVRYDFNPQISLPIIPGLSLDADAHSNFALEKIAK